MSVAFAMFGGERQQNLTLTRDSKGQENDLRDIQRQSSEDADLESVQGPDIHASDFLPRPESRKARERQETDDGIDFEAGERRPVLAHDGVHDEREPVEEKREACEGEEGIDESATVRASSDDDGGDWGGALWFGGRRTALEEQRESG